MSSSLIEASLLEGITLRQTMLEHTEVIAAGGELWVQTLRQGGVIYLAGNGGSAADAQHLAAEMIGRFERLNGYPALALTVDTSCLTALGNDFGFDEVFRRQVLALGRPGDLFVGLSTSGNSPNVVKAAEAARQRGLRVLGMTGACGGQLEPLCDVCLKVPSGRTCRVQEVHLTIGHIWCEMVEAGLPAADGSPMRPTPCG